MASDGRPSLGRENIATGAAGGSSEAGGAEGTSTTSFVVFLVFAGETFLGDVLEVAEDEVDVKVEVEVEDVGLERFGLEEEEGSRRMILPGAGFDAGTTTGNAISSCSSSTLTDFFCLTFFSFFGFGSFLSLRVGSGLTTLGLGASSRGRARASPRLAAEGRRIDSGGGEASSRPRFGDGGVVGDSRLGAAG